MVICGLLLRGSQKICKNSLQLVYDGLKLCLKIVQKLQTEEKTLNSWLAIKWKMHSIFTSSCFVIFVREQEIFWEHYCSLLHKAHCRAFSYSLWIWTRNTSQFLSCFLIASSGFVKEPRVSSSPYRWKWSKKGWKDLPRSIYRLLTGPGIEPRVQEFLSKAFSTVSHYCFQKHKTFAYYF